MRALLVYKSITICLSISLELYTDLFGLSLSNLWRFQDLSFLVWSHLPNLFIEKGFYCFSRLHLEITRVYTDSKNYSRQIIVSSVGLVAAVDSLVVLKGS